MGYRYLFISKLIFKKNCNMTIYLPDNTYTLNSSIDSNQKVDESEIQVLRMD